MSRILKCDVCGAEQNEEVADMYSIHRHSEESMEQADVCEDCIPDEILNATNVETFDPF